MSKLSITSLVCISDYFFPLDLSYNTINNNTTKIIIINSNTIIIQHFF